MGSTLKAIADAITRLLEIMMVVCMVVMFVMVFGLSLIHI